MSHFRSSSLHALKASKRCLPLTHPHTPSTSLRFVNLSFGTNAFSSIHTTNVSGVASPHDEPNEGLLSLLDVQGQETRARLKRGLALTVSTQAIRQSLAEQYMKELELQPQEAVVVPKGRRKFQRKALSLDFTTPLSPKQVHSPTLLAAGIRLPILPKQSSRVSTASIRQRVKLRLK